MVLGTLYGPPDNPRVSKCLIVAKYAGVELETTPGFTIKESTKTPEFLAKFPLGQSPAFEGKDGYILTENSAIAFYIANEGKNLLGKDKKEMAAIMKYMFFVESQIVATNPVLLYPIFGFIKYIQEMASIVKPRLEKALAHLDGEIGNKKYLVGNCISLADISIVSDLGILFKFLLCPDDQKKFANLTRYFTDLRMESNFKAFLGEAVFATAQPTYE